MKKLADKNINTPEYFDKLWALEGIYRFDPVRMQAFTDYIKEGDSVCDLGAGRFSFGEYALKLGIRADITAVDFSEYAKEQVLKEYPQINYIIGDVLNTKIDKKFDIVGSGEVIEHMDHPSDLVKEMARLTKSGGLMIVGTVDPDCDDAKNIEYPEHIWQFEKKDLIEMFISYGQTTYKRIGNYDYVYCRRR